MSTDVQDAELEAAIGEAELTEDEAARVRELVQEGGYAQSAIAFVIGEREEPDDDEPAPPPAEQPTGEPTKRQLGQLEAELVRHEKRVHEIMGPYVAGFVVCEPCGGIGLVAPGPPPPRPQTHEWFQSCAKCQGFGEVLTGSLREGFTSRDCPRCKGRGYLEALDAQGAPLAPQESAVAAGAVTTAPLEQPAPAADDGRELTFGTPSWMGNTSIGA